MHLSPSSVSSAILLAVLFLGAPTHASTLSNKPKGKEVEKKHVHSAEHFRPNREYINELEKVAGTLVTHTILIPIIVDYFDDTRVPHSLALGQSTNTASWYQYPWYTVTDQGGVYIPVRDKKNKGVEAIKYISSDDPKEKRSCVPIKNLLAFRANSECLAFVTTAGIRIKTLNHGAWFKVLPQPELKKGEDNMCMQNGNNIELSRRVHGDKMMFTRDTKLLLISVTQNLVTAFEIPSYAITSLNPNGTLLSVLSNEKTLVVYQVDLKKVEGELKHACVEICTANQIGTAAMFVGDRRLAVLNGKYIDIHEISDSNVIRLVFSYEHKMLFSRNVFFDYDPITSVLNLRNQDFKLEQKAPETVLIGYGGLQARIFSIHLFPNGRLEVSSEGTFGAFWQLLNNDKNGVLETFVLPRPLELTDKKLQKKQGESTDSSSK